MALKETIKYMRELLSSIEIDLVKAEAGNKAASQRVRTGTVSLEKLAKVYRKESIYSEKGIEIPVVRAKTTRTKTSKTPANVHHASAHQNDTPHPKAKATKPKAKSAHATSRPLQVKRPTAKLPKR